MKGRNAQVARIYRTISILEGAPHGLTVLELVDRLHERGFEVNKRTIYRDLDALRAAGFPLDERGKSDDQGTRWTIERTTKVSPYFVLGVRELFALYLARGVMEPLKDTPFYEDLHALFGKISDRLGTKGQAFLNELSEELRFEPGPKWGLGLKSDIVETVRAACAERDILTMTYASANSGLTTERSVGPHFLYFAQGSLYLVAEDLKDRIIKVFAVPRIAKASLTGLTYDGAPADPEAVFGIALGVFAGKEAQRVRIVFGPKVAPFVRERRWHQSQQVRTLETGHVECTLQVALTPELTQWVLGFGGQAKVLEPKALIDAVTTEAQRTLDQYAKKRAS